MSDPKRSGTEYRDDGQGWREISAAEVPASAALRSEVESYRSTVAALDAEIRRLKSEVERRRSDIKGEIMRHDDNEEIRDLRSRLAAAEADADRLAEALRAVAARPVGIDGRMCWCDEDPDQWGEPVAHDTGCKKASAALAGEDKP